jgi:hypothetical protein
MINTKKSISNQRPVGPDHQFRGCPGIQLLQAAGARPTDYQSEAVGKRNEYSAKKLDHNRRIIQVKVSIHVRLELTNPAFL